MPHHAIFINFCDDGDGLLEQKYFHGFCCEEFCTKYLKLVEDTPYCL